MSKILSVAVPSYNVEKYLDKCLTSFSDDRFSGRLDVMIVNDGSTDRTAEIAAGYAARYPDIFRLINKENGGHGSAVNTGIGNAQGKYFRIVDGDDWVNTENMAKLLDILETVDTDMVVDEKREVNMETGRTEFFPLPSGTVFGKPLNFAEICNDNDICTYIMLHTLSVKTSLLREHGIRLLEGIFYVDIEYIIKTTMEAHDIQFIDLEIYQYLVGNANQSVNYKNYVKRFEHHSKVTRELIRYGTEKQVSDLRLRQYLDRRICLLINTHMNISLIYDEDRRRGSARASEFRKYLKTTNLKYYKATLSRYRAAKLLHILGVDYNRLQSLKRR
jgi:glycosyltransferase involved in cell wall biosynthesis